ncbi:PaaI family thioesterase [Bacillus pinisoli]|uniref:PaaI family thioesterase n=1 Tax=Bacillus pinisoli TaxID=2901866 RepID=UPI001FF6756D|nr:PaaI family thioesterase [Bacillus pinisoli]
MNIEHLRSTFEEAATTQKPDFETFFLAKFFQLDISYGEEKCVVKFPVEEYMFNPQGSLHGGVISFVLDVSMGHLTKKFLGKAVTLEMKTQYLRPATSGIVSCEAQFLKKGRKIVYVESRLTNEQGKLLAIGNATWSRIE